jgi:hypothetical protein
MILNELNIVNCLNKLSSNGSQFWSSYWYSYYYFDDGDTYMRKGIRFVNPDQKFGVDVRITDDPGFGGVEDTDFEMIYGIDL